MLGKMGCYNIQHFLKKKKQLYSTCYLLFARQILYKSFILFYFFFSHLSFYSTKKKSMKALK